MPIYEDETRTRKDLDKLRRKNKCAICGERLDIFLDRESGKVFLACHNWPTSPPASHHEGIVREYQAQDEDYESDIRRLVEMENRVGAKATKALQKMPAHGQLTQPQAEHILSLVYPGAPKDEIIRCAILCRDFGLHPLMKEVYLIPFKDKDGKANYATVLGINATRKLMAQRGTYSYIDDTPRLMTEDEQKRIFGEVDAKNIVAITKLRTKDGLEAPGYGRWPREKEPYGTDKGNTKANMAFIRSERNAFSRLSPDALPEGIEVIDEAYVEVPDVGKVTTETGEVIEDKAEEVKPEEKPKPKAKTDKVVEEQPELLVEPAEKDETPIDIEQLTHITQMMKDAGMDLAAIGKYCNVDKGWNIRKLGDLVNWQYDELVEAFEKGKA